MALDGIEQLLGVIPGAVFEGDFDVFDIRDASGRIAFHDYQVRVVPDRNRADLILAAEKDSTVQSRDPNRLDRCKPGLDEQFDLTLIAKTRNIAVEADRIR